jgi:hypothetical protein
MAKTKETVFSEEGVPLADQQESADADASPAPEAEVHLREVGPQEMGEKRQLTEDEALEQADTINEVVLVDKNVQGDRLQDHLAFDNARRDEAIAQGVVKTTQEALWEIARQEEASAQGLDHIGDTTQKRLFREARAEEVRAGKLEQSQTAPVEPVTIGQGGRDQVAENKKGAEEAKRLRKELGIK